MFNETMADEKDFARVCQYGNPGSGKTSNMATLANVGKTLVFPFEPGLKPVALRKRGIDLSNLVRAKNLTSVDLMETFWKLKALEDDERPVGAMFDTMTALSNKTLKVIRNEFYTKAVAGAEAKGESWDKPKNWMPLDLYSELACEIGEIIEHFHDLPMHLAFTAHVRRDVDEDTQEIKYGPATTPKVQEYLNAYVDVLMWTRRFGSYDDGRPVFIGTVARVGDAIKYDVKDRLDILPTPHMVYPTMERIISYVNGDLTPDTDPLQEEFLEWQATAFQAPEVRAANAKKKEK